MKLLPAEVWSTVASLKFRSKATSGESSDPYVAVAMKHLLGGLLVEDEVVIVWTMTLNCICCWAEVNPGLLAVTKTVYWPGAELGARTNESMYDPDWSEDTSCTCTGGSFTCIETAAATIGLVWISETLPDIVTTSPGKYCGLSVDTVTVRALWEKTRGTRPRIDRMANTVSSLREADS